MNPKLERQERTLMDFSYRIFGPTTVHLEHELCLWMTSVCLTMASLYSLYRSSFGLVGDLVYLLVTYCWLSRHFLHRIICTADVGTSISKSPLQTLRWMWIIVTSGGQYFDVTTSVFASKHDRDYMAMDDYSRVSLSLSSTKDDKGSNGNGNGKGKDSFNDTYNKCKKKLKRKIEKWYRCIPPLQLLVLISTTIFIIWFFFQYMEAQSSYAIPLRHARNNPHMPDRHINDDNINGANMYGHGNNHNNYNPNDGQNQYHIKVNAELMSKKFEAKQGGRAAAAKEARDFVYSWIGMICMVAIWGTIGSLVLYGRVMPPLPDLVAGAPVTVGRGSHVSSSIEWK